MSSLYILIINPLLDILFANTLSPSIGGLFLLLCKSFLFWCSPTCLFLFWLPLLWCPLHKYHCQNPGQGAYQKSPRVSFMLEQWKTFLLPSYLVSQQLHTQRTPSASWKTILSASVMFSWGVTLLVTVSGKLKIASQIYLCPNPQTLSMLLYVAKVTLWVWLS